LNFIDLPLNHPKYKGKYADHVPVDLPHFYCTMSANQYPYARKAVDFAFSQPAAGKVGPLGKRAGLDVNELYTKVLRLEQFPDARSWINVGGEDRVMYGSDYPHNIGDMKGCLARVDNLPTAQKQSVRSSNALRIFGL